jgi:hypothetical protein
MTAPPRAPADPRDRAIAGEGEPSQYYDLAGNEVSLDVLCMREPAWAANRLREMWKERAGLHERGKAEGRAEAFAKTREEMEGKKARIAELVEACREATQGPWVWSVDEDNDLPSLAAAQPVTITAGALRDALTRREAEAEERGFARGVEAAWAEESEDPQQFEARVRADERSRMEAEVSRREARARAEALAAVADWLDAVKMAGDGPPRDGWSGAIRRGDGKLTAKHGADALSKALAEARAEGRRAERERVRAAERVSCRYAHEPPGSGDDRAKVVLIVRDANGRRESIDLRPEHFHVDDRDRLTEARRQGAMDERAAWQRMDDGTAPHKAVLAEARASVWLEAAALWEEKYGDDQGHDLGSPVAEFRERAALLRKAAGGDE